MVVHVWNSSSLGGRGRKIPTSTPDFAKLARLYLKNKKYKQTG
jgi:hypothetical protein